MIEALAPPQVREVDQYERIVHHDSGERDDSHHADHAQVETHDDMSQHCTHNPEGDRDHDDDGLNIASEDNPENPENRYNGKYEAALEACD